MVHNLTNWLQQDFAQNREKHFPTIVKKKKQKENEIKKIITHKRKIKKKILWK